MASDYSKYYTPEALTTKIRKFAKKAGSKVTYYVLLLYNVMNNKSTPVRAKLTIAAALGYFILPTDAIPDLLPVLGFTDDLGVLMFALKKVADHVTPEIKHMSKEKCRQLFRLNNEEPSSENWDTEAGI